MSTNDILSSLDWAINTIRDRVMFGRDELGASKARELRAKGVMIDAVEEIKKRDEAIEVMRDALIDITDYGENYAPEGNEIWLLAYTSLKKAEQILGGEG